MMKCIKLIDKFAVVLMASLLLAACGGGAGSTPTPTPTPTPGVSGTGNYAVPNSLIPSAGTGSKDSYYMANCRPTNNRGSGCYTIVGTNELFNIVEDNINPVYSNGITLANGHRRIEGPIQGDPRLEVRHPPIDVRQAWRDGWTGEGVDLLILDEFGLPPLFLGGNSRTGSADDADTHGYTVALSFSEIAPGANIHGANFGLIGSITEGRYLQGGLVVGSNQRMEVVNMSFGRGSLGRVPTTNEINSYRRSSFFADLIGQGSFFRNNLADAVLVKAAGNDRGANASFSVDNVVLVGGPHTGPRTLIVGALDKYARTRDPQNQDNVSTSARIAGYSNWAGHWELMQQRFLVEYGATPYGERAYLCDSNTPASSRCSTLQLLDEDGPIRPSPAGTSFAAPRVAGFAALVRDKFPRLSGGQTAKILLDTATTRGLACHRSGQKDHRNCSVQIYGQGRVDIGSALSPIGRLR